MFHDALSELDSLRAQLKKAQEEANRQFSEVVNLRHKLQIECENSAKEHQRAEAAEDKCAAMGKMP
jgi:hypothetical protein